MESFLLSRRNKLDNIAEIFEEEVAEKKMIALSAKKKGNSPKSQKGWYNFGMPKGYLTAKEQEKLGGEVKVYNMKDKLEGVKEYKEVMAMPLDEGKAYISKLREKYSISKLSKHWGVSTYLIYNKMFKKFNIEKMKAAIEATKPILKEVSAVVEEKKTTPVSFAIEMNGEMTAADLTAKIRAIADMLYASQSNYQVSFKVTEVNGN